MKRTSKSAVALDRELAAERRVLDKLAKRPLMAMDFSMAERRQLHCLEDEGRVHYHDGLWYAEEVPHEARR